jgi:hypothetical protein
LSGSPLTTDGNTLINAYIAYAAARESSYSIYDAFNKCGVFYGDDSLVAGDMVSATTFQNTATFHGLTLKVATVKRNNPVTFLARVFLNPWASDSTMQDPVRVLPKLCSTIDSVSDMKTCTIAKASGYLVTDKLTPLVADYCYMLLSVHDSLISHTDNESASYASANREDVSWWVRDDESRQRCWIQHKEDIPLMIEIMATRLNVESSEIDRSAQLMRNTITMEQMTERWEQFRIDTEDPKPKVNAIVIRDGHEHVAELPPPALLDHHHKGLERNGHPIKHWHSCTTCNETFTHSHTIKTYQESLKYPQLCKACTAKNRGTKKGAPDQSKPDDLKLSTAKNKSIGTHNINNNSHNGQNKYYKGAAQKVKVTGGQSRNDQASTSGPATDRSQGTKKGTKYNEHAKRNPDTSYQNDDYMLQIGSGTTAGSSYFRRPLAGHQRGGKYPAQYSRQVGYDGQWLGQGYSQYQKPAYGTYGWYSENPSDYR